MQARSSFDRRDDRQSGATRGGCECSVPRHERCSPRVDGERRRQMDRVAASQAEPRGDRTGEERQVPAKLDHIHRSEPAIELRDRGHVGPPRDPALSGRALECGSCLGVRRRRGHLRLHAVPHRANDVGPFLRQEELHERRRVEVRDQRRRCSMMMSLTDPRTGIGGRASAGSAGRLAGLTLPSAISWSSFERPVTGTMRATGVPRSVTVISLPEATVSSHALRWSRSSRMPTSARSAGSGAFDMTEVYRTSIHASWAGHPRPGRDAHHVEPRVATLSG